MSVELPTKFCSRPLPRLIEVACVGMSDLPAHPLTTMTARVNNLPCQAKAFWLAIGENDSKGTSNDKSSCTSIEALVSVLTSEDYYIPRTMAEHHQQFLPSIDCAIDLLKVLSHQGLALPFIRMVIKQDVDATSSLDMMLRRNNGASRLLVAYAHLAGEEFRIALLRPTLLSVLEMHPPTDETSSPVTLFIVAQTLINQLLETPAPRPLCEFIALLYDEISKRFGDGARNIVSSFFFLRFICPAILNPHESQILLPSDIVSPASKQTMLALSKILQALANNVDYSLREDSLPRFANFLETNKHAMNAHFHKMYAVAIQHETCEHPKVTNADVVMRRLIKHLSAQVADMSARAKPRFAEEQVVISAKDVLHYSLKCFTSALTCERDIGALFIDHFEEAVLSSDIDIFHDLVPELQPDQVTSFVEGMVNVAASRGCGLDLVNSTMQRHLHAIAAPSEFTATMAGPVNIACLTLLAYLKLASASFFQLVLVKTIESIRQVKQTLNITNKKDCAVVTSWVAKLCERVSKYMSKLSCACCMTAQLIMAGMNTRFQLQGTTMVLKILSMSFTAALRDPVSYGVTQAPLTMVDAANVALLIRVLDGVICGSTFTGEPWTTFNPTVQEHHGVFEKLVAHSLSAAITSAEISQWEYEQLASKPSWSTLRIGYLRVISRQLQTFLLKLDATLSQRISRKHVVYNPIDRLFVVVSALQLSLPDS